MIRVAAHRRIASCVRRRWFDDPDDAQGPRSELDRPGEELSRRGPCQESRDGTDARPDEEGRAEKDPHGQERVEDGERGADRVRDERQRGVERHAGGPDDERDRLQEGEDDEQDERRQGQDEVPQEEPKWMVQRVGVQGREDYEPRDVSKRE